jgi:hypothetical protein
VVVRHTHTHTNTQHTHWNVGRGGGRNGQVSSRRNDFEGRWRALARHRSNGYLIYMLDRERGRVGDGCIQISGELDVV